MLHAEGLFSFAAGVFRWISMGRSRHLLPGEWYLGCWFRSDLADIVNNLVMNYSVDANIADTIK